MTVLQFSLRSRDPGNLAAATLEEPYAIRYPHRAIMRSLGEWKFRISQELTNLLLWLRPPSKPSRTVPTFLPGLPDGQAAADALRTTPFAHRIQDLADEILSHRFPVFDRVLET